MDAVLKWFGDWGFIASTVGAIVFLVIYSVVARWWRTWWGRQIFSFMAVIGGSLIFGAVRLVFGDYPGINYVRPIAFVSLAGVIWWLVGVLVYYQIIRRGRSVVHDAQDKPTRVSR